MLNKFATELKEARAKSEISLEQIAAKTRIDLKFLENIENGNFSFLPELYIKAFLREYSKLVGLDEQITLKKFDAVRKGKQYDELGNIEEEIKKPKIEKEEVKPASAVPEKPAHTYEAYTPPAVETRKPFKLDKKQMTIAGISGGALILLIIIYFGFINGSSEIIVSEKPYNEVMQANEPRYVQNTQSPQTANTADDTPGDSLTLHLKSEDSSWIKILMDGSRIEEYTLLPNSAKDFKARRNYQLIVGNAAAIHFTLDNKPLKFTGAKHEVKYISIDSTGLKYLSEPPKF